MRPLLPGAGAGRAVITARRLLAGLEGVRRLALPPLALPEATELLTGILGDRAASDGEPALTRLAGLCDGLPLALRIIGNRLVSRPGWDAAELAVRLADEERRLDQFKAGDLEVASAFGMSFEQLADSAQRMFRRLAVVPGRDFDADLAAIAGGMSAGDAWEALDELGAGLADEAILVPAHHPRPDDPAGPAAGHVRAGQSGRHRGPRRPRHLCVPAGRRRRAYKARRQGLQLTPYTFAGKAWEKPNRVVPWWGPM